MTRDQFVEHYRHEFLGMVCEALRTDAKGGDLGMRLTAIEGKILKHLNQMYHQLTAKESTPPTNGKGANHAAPPQEAKPRWGSRPRPVPHARQLGFLRRKADFLDCYMIGHFDRMGEPQRVLSHPSGSTPLAVGGLTMSDHSTTTKRICQFDGCGRKHDSRGYCIAHARQFREGKLLTPIGFREPHIPTIVYHETPCQNPTLTGPCHTSDNTKHGRGYRVITFRKKMMLLHRYIWERDVGPIPEGMQVDHQCRNRACCNINHLRIVTPKVNLLENTAGCAIQMQAAKTHCPHGHPYDEKNTYLRLKPHGQRSRACRICRRSASRRVEAKRKEERNAANAKETVA